MEITSKIFAPSQTTGTDSTTRVVDGLAKTGDIEGAKAFASRHPEHAQLLGQAFAEKSPGLLHLLQEQVPTAFASASPLAHTNLQAPPTDPNDPGGGGGGVVDEPPVVVTAPVPPPAPPAPAPAPPPSGGDGPVHGGGGSGGGGINSASGAHRYLIQRLDLDFIRGHEATYEEVLDAKVPEDKQGQPLGSSGVTIGYGVDLGHYDPASLQALADSGSLKQSFVDKIMPYVGKTGSEAQSYLGKHSLSFTESDRPQLNVLSDIRYAHIFLNLSTNYYNATAEAGETPHFLDELPKEAVTSVMDVAVQYGSLSEKTPNFWSQISHDQWSKAADNLHDFGDNFKTRRHDDETELRKAISAGLKDGGY